VLGDDLRLASGSLLGHRGKLLLGFLELDRFRAGDGSAICPVCPEISNSDCIAGSIIEISVVRLPDFSPISCRQLPTEFLRKGAFFFLYGLSILASGMCSLVNFYSLSTHFGEESRRRLDWFRVPPSAPGQSGEIPECGIAGKGLWTIS
jgi:hypothetical protein